MFLSFIKSYHLLNSINSFLYPLTSPYSFSSLIIWRICLVRGLWYFWIFGFMTFTSFRKFLHTSFSTIVLPYLLPLNIWWTLFLVTMSHVPSTFLPLPSSPHPHPSSSLCASAGIFSLVFSFLILAFAVSHGMLKSVIKFLTLIFAVFNSTLSIWFSSQIFHLQN